MKLTLATLFTAMLMIGCIPLSEQQKQENREAFNYFIKNAQNIREDLTSKIYEGGVESLFKRRFGNEKSITIREVTNFISYHFEDEISMAQSRLISNHFELSEQRRRNITDDLVKIYQDGAQKSVDKAVYEIAKDLVEKGGFL